MLIGTSIVRMSVCLSVCPVLYIDECCIGSVMVRMLDLKRPEFNSWLGHYLVVTTRMRDFLPAGKPS